VRDQSPLLTPLLRFARLCLAPCAAMIGPGFAVLPAHGGEAPESPRIVADEGKPATERAVAERDVLALDTSMRAVYEDSLSKYKQTMRARVPIILALFSEAGGRMILYRPGQEPLVAEPVPLVYQLAKSVSHSSMAVYQLVAPYVERPSDTSWRGPMQAYRTRCQTALESLDALDITSDERAILRAILDRGNTFMDECLKTGTFTPEGLAAFARAGVPDFGKTIGIASRAQVAHWMGVLERWKAMLGEDWEQTYAASNTIYVTRHNNVLFTVLAQFMGQKAMGDRLLLLETTEFTTTPEAMLDLLARIVSDRALGKVFFKDYFLMDAELLGGGARKAIAAEATKRGMTPLLPPLTPFYSNGWPWNTDPKIGKGPSSLEEAK